MASGFFGNYFSVQFTESLAKSYPSARIILPTGPMIVIVATSICIFALLFASERGMLVRLWRASRFRFTCICENILKTMWRQGPYALLSLEQIAKYQSISTLYLRFLLWRMARNRWIVKEKNQLYHLTADGRFRAQKIVRLHRLWEVYLVNYIGLGVERVHCNAEEIEHILTPQLESQLIHLLEDPKHDPHQQPIPPRERANDS
jgi:manganese/zinc/iron transport system permease protein